MPDHDAPNVEPDRPAERAHLPEPIPLTTLTDAVVTLIHDDTLDGRILILRPDKPAHLLPPDG